MSDEMSGVFLEVPLPDEQVFRYKAADDILELLYRNPHRKFTVTELRKTTDHGGKSVDNAIQILDSLDLIQKERDGRRSLIRINQEKIRKPDDPLLEIPQEEFRKPVRAFVEAAMETQGDNLVGILVFGSVARGEADRASDIDVQTIVKDDLVAARRELQDVRQQIENQTFDGNRYEIQLLVESVESSKNYGGKLQEIFSQGISIFATDELQAVQETVFHGE
ncbi:nucleotidyltransferase domain-containing protein [Halorussus gelatinilyticus]|uniref:Nucleotidyltransferase domain-containing protein n=1 Tax=Halorussus gelatinilyticus TaxID=2937524 RepID=A0A8U0IMX0_9EURY|nr:nucleotidyltransferase domain-containing protein [Halorussus gelatinilyticus]UPW01369.1 nucleotidyltransferase domain-containing protein [Halorussus gelatinilyticus]